MSVSQSSFYSDAQQVDPEQAAKLKKLAKPFSLTNKKHAGGTTNPALMGMTKPEQIDDMLSELSTPGLDEDIAA